MPAPVPNARTRLIEESVTLAIAARSLALKAAGRDVVSLGAGEPDFPTPERIARAGVQAIEQGRYRYTATSGVPELRAAGARWFEAAFGLRYAPDEVMVTAGAKPALLMALDAIVEPGDRVLILAPYWVSYPALVRMAGGEPVIVEPVPDQGFVHDAAAIEAAVRKSGAKGLIVNYPNNPSGAVASRAQIEALVRVAVEHDLWIVSDEIYAQLRYDGAEHVSPAACPGGRERSLVVSGFTKSHTLTGWRIGFLAGSKAVIEAAGRVQSQVLGNPCTISQEAARAACAEPPHEEAARRVVAFDERRRFLLAEINKLPGLRLSPPRGAFYALVDARELCARRRLSDLQISQRLLEEQLLATVPGSAFGIPGFVRLSYAASMSDLQKGVARLYAFANGER
jgi:aspartate aminotransferase